VSTIALKVLELVKSLPPEEQRLIYNELTKQARQFPSSMEEKDPGALQFTPEDYEGIDNDDPFFKVMEEIEAERHRTPGPPSPEFD